MILLKQKGLTLLEVLLAWGVLGFFCSSAMWAEVEFLQKNRLQREYKIAQWQLEEMAERLLANKTPQARDREWRRWKEQNDLLFSHSKSECHCEEGRCELRLSWGQHHQVQLWV